ncbi:hypothetical protein EV144_102305 [Flavobacterium sp. 270]|uniref:hypothetical protein n=1 Tax=Flavobacterium sp. 270 TaxID=2512114 RepID=UPI0010663960|nr:hypothetical protein [Flavobacterium sp. 270]TDW49877.1 hypothetical protein EV144_102305 [Flavobacterium sp. 270]
MRKFKTFDTTREYYEELSFKEFEKILDKMGFSSKDLKYLSSEQLRNKLEELDNLLKNKELNEKHSTSYFENEDYILEDKRSAKNRVGFYISIETNLIAKKKEVFELLKSIERDDKIDSVSKLVKNIENKDLQTQLTKELKELQQQAGKFAQEEKAIDKEFNKINLIKEELELSRSRLDIFDKKSQIWLKILAKESIASILGGVILFIMTVSLLVSMFIGIKTTSIIENAFLLILGYFFGQAVSKNKNE